MSFRSVEELLDDQLQELHAAEVHIVKGLPALLDGAFSKELKSLLGGHIQESERHEQTLAVILKKRSISPHIGRCRVVDALLKRGREIAETRGSSVLLDVGLVFVLRAIEAYEHCSYSAAKTLAEALSLSEVVEALETNSRDEEKMEQACAVLSEDMLDAVQLNPSSTSSSPSPALDRGLAEI
jgi:ferritin-like metal-binding protein YciE